MGTANINPYGGGTPVGATKETRRETREPCTKALHLAARAREDTAEQLELVLADAMRQGVEDAAREARADWQAAAASAEAAQQKAEEATAEMAAAKAAREQRAWERKVENEQRVAREMAREHQAARDEKMAREQFKAAEEERAAAKEQRIAGARGPTPRRVLSFLFFPNLSASTLTRARPDGITNARGPAPRRRFLIPTRMRAP